MTAPMQLEGGLEDSGRDARMTAVLELFALESDFKPELRNARGRASDAQAARVERVRLSLAREQTQIARAALEIAAGQSRRADQDAVCHERRCRLARRVHRSSNSIQDACRRYRRDRASRGNTTRSLLEQVENLTRSRRSRQRDELRRKQRRVEHLVARCARAARRGLAESRAERAAGILSSLRRTARAWSAKTSRRSASRAVVARGYAPPNSPPKQRLASAGASGRARNPARAARATVAASGAVTLAFATGARQPGPSWRSAHGGESLRHHLHRLLRADMESREPDDCRSDRVRA